MPSSARELLYYLIGKRSEIEDLDLKDALLAKVVLDIHRKRTHKEVVVVPLASLHQIHALDRETALETTRLRAETLTSHKQELLASGVLTCELLARFLPSVSWIKVVRNARDSYLAFEGNGRIAAMKAVFDRSNELFVEVEEYSFRNPSKIIRRLDRVRQLNGLLDHSRDHQVGDETI